MNEMKQGIEMDEQAIKDLKNTLFAFFLDIRKQFADCDEDTVTLADVQNYIDHWIEDEIARAQYRRK